MYEKWQCHDSGVLSYSRGLQWKKSYHTLLRNQQKSTEINQEITVLEIIWWNRLQLRIRPPLYLLIAWGWAYDNNYYDAVNGFTKIDCIVSCKMKNVLLFGVVMHVYKSLYTIFILTKIYTIINFYHALTI